VRLLIPKRNRTINGRIIYYAVKDNQYDFVKELLTTKTVVDINIRIDGKTALGWAVKNKNIEMARVLIGVEASDSLYLEILISDSIQNNEPELTMLLLAQNNHYPLIGRLFTLLQQHNFSPEIKNCFLDSYKILKVDETTEPKTKEIIFQHFIDILEKNLVPNGAGEEKDEEKNLRVIQEIVASELLLKSKLKGNAPMSIYLKIALGMLFGTLAIFVTVNLFVLYAGIGIGIGKLLLGSFIASFITTVPPIGYLGYFSNKEYKLKSEQSDSLANSTFHSFKETATAKRAQT
jgi:hypothetical protein